MIQGEMERRIARRLGIPRKHARRMYHAVRDEILQALKDGEDVWLRNFIHIEVRQDKPRMRTDPRGGTQLMPAQNRVLTRPGIDMKLAVGQRVREQKRWDGSKWAR